MSCLTVPLIPSSLCAVCVPADDGIPLHIGGERDSYTRGGWPVERSAHPEALLMHRPYTSTAESAVHAVHRGDRMHGCVWTAAVCGQRPCAFRGC